MVLLVGVLLQTMQLPGDQPLINTEITLLGGYGHPEVHHFVFALITLVQVSVTGEVISAKVKMFVLLCGLTWIS